MHLGMLRIRYLSLNNCFIKFEYLQCVINNIIRYLCICNTSFIEALNVFSSIFFFFFIVFTYLFFSFLTIAI